MGYVQNNLMSGEEVLFNGIIHWLIYMPAILIAACSMTMLAVFFSLSDNDNATGAVLIILGISLMPCAIYSFLKAFIFRKTTELAITTKRVIAKTGLIKRETTELSHSKIESFNVTQSILGRIFNFGTLVIHGTGGAHTPIQGIKTPMEFRRQAMEAIELSET
ncbi:hypothetical protein ACH42_17150 [Endozoicomonas sp. (ex Bugula neritina AB1)]|nr:hypothetical protein ACH42_17150 [Endozoicomonas sp. (ex Bugula neritina AB1)]